MRSPPRLLLVKHVIVKQEKDTENSQKLQKQSHQKRPPPHVRLNPLRHSYANPHSVNRQFNFGTTGPGTLVLEEKPDGAIRWVRGFP